MQQDTSVLLKEYAKYPSVDLRNKIVEGNLYIVDALIRKYLGKGVDYDDLYQVGAMALVSAVERFDPSKGFEFRSFATPTILGEIKKHFRDREWSLKVPRRLKEVSGKVQETKEKLTTSLGRAPTVEELAGETGLSHEMIIQAQESAKAFGTYSLDGYSTGEDDKEATSLEKFIGFEDTGFEKIEIEEIINSVLESFSETYRYIFKQRFILNKSQVEIARKLGVSQMTISRTEKAIIKSFQNELHMQ